MSENKCPLCKQSVSQEVFEKITGVWRTRKIQERALKEKQKELIKKYKEQQEAFEAEKRKLKSEQKESIEKRVAVQTKRFTEQLARLEAQKKKIQDQSDKKIASAIKSAERKAKAEAKEGIKAQLEESIKKAVAKQTTQQSKTLYRVNRTLDSTKKQMSTLQLQGMKQQEKIKNLENQLKNQTTPQIEGLLYEDQLVEALKKDFPHDKIIHTGKGGDILQEIIFQGQNCGSLMYECKRVTQWQTAHADQAFNARIQRHADFAILVTNAPKKGSGGFFIEKDVIVVNPGGVLAIAAILRDQIIRMMRLKLTHAQKEEAVEQTLKYLQGAEFKNSLELIIKKTIEMYEDLKKECQDHVKAWRKRHESLKSVYVHTAQVRTKTTELIAGKKDNLLIEVQPFPALPDLTQV